MWRVVVLLIVVARASVASADGKQARAENAAAYAHHVKKEYKAAAAGYARAITSLARGPVAGEGHPRVQIAACAAQRSAHGISPSAASPRSVPQMSQRP